MNLHEKLVAIRKDIGGFTKDKKSYNYSYVSGTQVLAKVQSMMNELGVLLVPKINTQDFQKHEYTNSKGKAALDFIVNGQMTYTWINAEKPEDILEIPFFYVGAQDDVSKAFGSGLTYSERYFIIKFFNLPTDADDPDGRDTSGRSGKGNYNNQTNNQMKQTTPIPPKNIPAKLVMPKDANEAWNMVMPDMFSKHKGKTIGAVWKEDMPYIGQILSMDKAPIEITEGITLIQVAMAAKAAKEKQVE